MQLTTAVTAQPHAVARKQSKYKKSTSTSDSSSDSSSSEDSSSSSSSEEQDEDDSSPERLKHKAIASMRSKQKEGGKKEHVEQRSKHKEEQNKVDDKKFNYVFYDPEMHWCKTCDILPKTAKDYLNHLHSKEHLERERVETPWHAIMVNDQYPVHENAPTKRTPIRGLTFFVPATAWYCKLCNIWMGDLHCASSHLKSQEHANKYNAYLEQHPHFEVDWLAERQRALNTKRAVPPPQQITSVSTTASEHVSKKSKKDEEKSKKRKKKSSDKKDKKKKKRSKKRKKAAVSSSSSSSSAESTSENEEPKYAAPALNNANPAASIRVAMRKQSSKIESIETEIPPAPSMKLPPPQPVSGPIGKWTVTQEGIKKSNEEESKRDDAIISQWNTVQPVISESEKKLLEQLKGKLKNKPNIMESHSAITVAGMAANAIKNSASATISSDRAALEAMGKGKERSSSRRDDKERGGGSAVDSESRGRRRSSRSRSPRYGSRGGRSRSRSRGRGGYRGRGGGGGGGRRSRSRSRGRFSPVGWRDGGGRRRISRSRSMRRRSRSFDRRRRGGSRSSRSRSGSPRIEKAVVRLSEFRPRVPEKDKEKEIKKQTDAKEKKESNKKAAAAAKTKTSGESTAKKLPFIGKMPVFKKHASGAEGGADQKDEVYDEATAAAHMAITQAAAARNMAPTAAQIQMAMMEDVYGNAPPFHPDNMMMDYDDLMPDPVQFVSIMGQAPPPPPPESDDDKDMLPPGIDETESEEFVPKPISEAPIARKGPLPKDFEEALNIIFPGDKRPGDDDADRKKKSSGETQIIVDAPVMQPEDLAREGIHMVTLEETMDEASQLSMNEPLIFKKRSSSSATACAPEDASSQNASDIDLANIEPPSQLPKIAEEVEVAAALTTEVIATPVTAPPAPAAKEIVIEDVAKVAEIPAVVETVSADPPAVELATITLPMEDIPIPAPPAAAADVVVDETSAVVYDLDDIPQPPPSPTESEKHRRQEELDDLAMLGIDASDMAAQCM